jgi:hypothetical protein
MAFALLGAAASTALATPVINVATGPDGTPNTFSEVTSLISQGQSTYLSDSYTFPPYTNPDSTPGNGDPFGSGVDSLNTVNSGGNLYAVNSGDTTGSLTPYNGTNPAGCVATFNLNTSVNTQGYDITSLISLTGYSDTDLTGQAYTVAFSTVSNPSVFTDYATVSASSGGNNEVEVTLTDTSATLATNVAAVQFTFATDPANAFTDIYRQMEVFGSPSAAVPEPASLSLLSLGGLALLRRRRRQLA